MTCGNDTIISKVIGYDDITAASRADMTHGFQTKKSYQTAVLLGTITDCHLSLIQQEVLKYDQLSMNALAYVYAQACCFCNKALICRVLPYCSTPSCHLLNLKLYII